MQTRGTSIAGSPFCRRASRNSAAGWKADGAEGFLFVRMGAMVYRGQGCRLADESRRTQTGSVNSKIVPQGTFERAESRPPSPSMIDLQIASPIPRPAGLVV